MIAQNVQNSDRSYPSGSDKQTENGNNYIHIDNIVNFENEVAVPGTSADPTEEENRKDSSDSEGSVGFEQQGKQQCAQQ
jgi:hypothetical protein